MQGAHTDRFATGIRMSTPIQAFLDLASGGASLVDLVIAVTVSSEQTTSTQRCSSWALLHIRAQRQAGSPRSFAGTRRVDSPMETRIRLLIVLAGLPEPQVNFVVRHANGKWRCDSTSAIRNTS
jgi:hypothetical protein